VAQYRVISTCLQCSLRYSQIHSSFIIFTNNYFTKAVSNVRQCWTKVSLQRRLLIICKIYHNANAYINNVDEPAQVEQVLQDEPGNYLDDLWAYMSDIEENCDTNQSVDQQNHDNDHDHV
jgi:hypothetical protein